jgi:ABC-2 type transport system ATP-binding protein
MISLQHIDYHYSQHAPLFSNLNLEIPKGCLFGLLGPNGAGKTTLISLMTGQRTPTAGKVRIDGTSYREDRYAILNKLAHIPQEYAFYPQLSALENLQFFSGLYSGSKRQRAQQIEKALTLSGLSDQAHRLAKHFSGGLKRRLNLAIGMLNQPKLVFLDEPTVGIDPQSRHFILESIRELNQAGSTIVYTSHYIEEIEQLCNEVAIIDHGDILVHGPLHQVLEKRPLLQVTLDLSDHSDKTEQLAREVAALGFNLTQQTLSGYPKTEQGITELLQLIEAKSIRIVNLSYGRHTLEKLFFELTQTHLRE